jgi:hypothetical protein
MTEPELRQLALDIVDRKVYGSWMIPEDQLDRLLSVVFMPLLFGAAENLRENKAVSLYEYLDKAGPTGVNGYPSFMSCRFLTKEDTELLNPMITKLREMRQSFIQGDQS